VGLSKWELRSAFDLPSPKVAHLLQTLIHRPDIRHSIERLALQLSTTPRSVIVLVSQLRRALSPFGLRPHLVTIDKGYRISSSAAQEIRNHCQQHGTVHPLPSTDSHLLHRILQMEGRLEPSIMNHGEQPIDAGFAPNDPNAEIRGKMALRSPSSALPSFGNKNSLQLKVIGTLFAHEGKFVPVPRIVRELGCSSDTLKVTVFNIRKKFKAAGWPDPIESRHSRGYRIVVNTSPPSAAEHDCLVHDLGEGGETALPAKLAEKSSTRPVFDGMCIR
jgi:DNA-binding winged helix-turn-helix (wHTH) protein